MQADSLSGEAKKAKLAEAEAKLKAVLQIAPNFAFALGCLGVVFRMQAYSLRGEAKVAKLVEAEAKLKADVEINPNDAVALGRLGEVLRMMTVEI